MNTDRQFRNYDSVQTTVNRYNKCLVSNLDGYISVCISRNCNVYNSIVTDSNVCKFNIQGGVDFGYGKSLCVIVACVVLVVFKKCYVNRIGSVS